MQLSHLELCGPSYAVNQKGQTVEESTYVHTLESRVYLAKPLQQPASRLCS